MRVQSTSWIKEAYLLNDFMKQPTEAGFQKRERAWKKGRSFGLVR
jgi:hypothetical protein